MLFSSELDLIENWSSERGPVIPFLLKLELLYDFECTHSSVPLHHLAELTLEEEKECRTITESFVRLFKGSEEHSTLENLRLLRNYLKVKKNTQVTLHHYECMYEMTCKFFAQGPGARISETVQHSFQRISENRRSQQFTEEFLTRTLQRALRNIDKDDEEGIFKQIPGGMRSVFRSAADRDLCRCFFSTYLLHDGWWPHWLDFKLYRDLLWLRFLKAKGLDEQITLDLHSDHDDPDEKSEKTTTTSGSDRAHLLGEKKSKTSAPLLDLKEIPSAASVCGEAHSWCVVC